MHLQIAKRNSVLGMVRPFFNRLTSSSLPLNCFQKRRLSTHQTPHFTEDFCLKNRFCFSEKTFLTSACLVTEKGAELQLFCSHVLVFDDVT